MTSTVPQIASFYLTHLFPPPPLWLPLLFQFENIEDKNVEGRVIVVSGAWVPHYLLFHTSSSTPACFQIQGARGGGKVVTTAPLVKLGQHSVCCFKFWKASSSFVMSLSMAECKPDRNANLQAVPTSQICGSSRQPLRYSMALKATHLHNLETLSSNGSIILERQVYTCLKILIL